VRTRSCKFFTVFLSWTLFHLAAARGQERIVLVETGSSMPEPLYKSWIDEFHQQRPSTDIRYMATGTAESARTSCRFWRFGVGTRQFRRPCCARPDGRFLTPAVLIGIVVIYELPDVKGELKLTGPVLANIFLGKIRSWTTQDREAQPDMKLPELPSSSAPQ